MKSKTYTATVICEVRVSVSGTWSSDCTMSQIERQAEESADGILRHLLSPEPMVENHRALYKILHSKAIARVGMRRVVSVEVKARKDASS